jgi:hypothetical protein
MVLPQAVRRRQNPRGEPLKYGVTQMRSSSLTASAITAVLMLSACATFGRVDRTFTPSQVPKTIFVSERQSEHEARHINQVIRTFEKYGYEVVKQRTQAAYYLDFSITGGLVVTVEISLLKVTDGTSVLNVSSTNRLGHGHSEVRSYLGESRGSSW